ncbi:carboxylesterase family protein [Pseudonocardia kujensis]|nr:carboxylesterase family protein [Pseudonocardia kujensis]MCE0763556.1 carboxylesterase family protein [Pseudonocardia kujensis]
MWLLDVVRQTGSGVDCPLLDDAFLTVGGVVVAVEYRLGVLCLLHLDEDFDGIEGTCALGQRDQLAAVEWVGEHIEAFEDEPREATGAGDEAGAGALSSCLRSGRRCNLFAPLSCSRDVRRRLPTAIRRDIGLPAYSRRRAWARAPGRR